MSVSISVTNVSCEQTQDFFGFHLYHPEQIRHEFDWVIRKQHEVFTTVFFRVFCRRGYEKKSRLLSNILLYLRNDTIEDEKEVVCDLLNSAIFNEL